MRGQEAPTTRRVDFVAYAGFAVIGWSMLLVPSLVRAIKSDFDQTDAGLGLLFFATALFFAVGAFLSGALAGRLGRRRILPAAALLLGAGLATEALAPSWTVFVVGAGLAGAGAGTLDAGLNGVVMDLSVTGRGSALSMLHLFYSVGALTAPLAVGATVGVGVDWRVPMLLTGLIAVALAVPMRIAGAVPARPRRQPRGDTLPAGTGGPTLRLPLVALGVAVACYVAAEAGVSSWLVVFLAEEPIGAATLALGMFWAGLAVGRLVAARIADRFPALPFAVACVAIAAIALLGGIVAPPGACRIALFALAGFGLGPIYPMVMTVAGTYYPHRAAAVSGMLTAAGVGGSVVYPPLMGVASGAVGLRAGMLGAVVLLLATGAAVVMAGRLAGRLDGVRAEPEPTTTSEARD